MASNNRGRPAISAAIEKFQAALERLSDQLDVLRGQLIAQGDEADQLPSGSVASPLPGELVTLDQMGAIVRRSKRTMERRRREMPSPRVQSQGGGPNLWAWNDVRPWLENAFGLQLPEHFPRLHR
jgi:hypothetical protein